MQFRIAIAVGLMLVASGAAVSWSSADTLRERAAALANGQRPYALRLTGQNRWVGCRRAAADSLEVRCADFVPDRARIDDALQLVRDARAQSDARWELATVDLLAGRGGANASVSTIDRLESMIAADTTNANLRNDLAVGYLARGDAWTLFLGLDQIERAFAIDSASPVIAFNRAMVLGLAHLSAESRRAWVRYLRDHGERGWSDEARERLAAAEAKLRPRLFDGRRASLVAEARRDPQHAREFVLDSLLLQWAQARTNGTTVRADSACERIEAIGVLISEKSGDRSITDIARACRATGLDVAAEIFRFADGTARFRRGDFAAADSVLGIASVRLRMLGAAPVAEWADVTRGFVDIYSHRYARADSAFAAVEREAEFRGDSALKARALWGRGLSASWSGAQAVDFYQRAAALYLSLDEPLNRASMISQAADVLLLLGRDETGMRGKFEALALMDRRLDARVRPGPLVAFGMELVELGLPAAAVAVLREAVGEASTSDRPHDRPEALIQLANAEVAAGRERIGRAHLAEALSALAAVRDTLMLQRQKMAAALALASSDSATTPDSAIAQLTEVEAYYSKSRLQYNRAVPLARRGRLRLRQGDSAGGQRDIAQAVQAIERQAVDLNDPRAARDRAAAQREVYETIVSLTVDRGDTTAGFLLAERSRGNLLEQVPAIAPDRVVLSYFALPDRLLMWIVRGKSFRLVAQPVRVDELRSRVLLAESLIRVGDDTEEWRKTSRSTFDLLIAPAMREIDGARSITVVADGPLGRLTFAALRGSDGRYLAELAELTHATASRAAAGASLPQAAPVVVGHPLLDPIAFPDLGPLPGAEREVAAVRRLYPNASVIDGAAATKNVVSRAMQNASMFHFAGHARLVERTPSQSHLVLAAFPTGGVAGSVLSADEIAKMDLRRMQLAVLSSCGTTQARSRRDRAQSGLSDAFLAAGASAVISSRWTVDDAGTAELMNRLYAELARGEPPAAALGRAQAALIRSRSIDRVLRVWAAFVYEER